MLAERRILQVRPTELGLTLRLTDNLTLGPYGILRGGPYTENYIFNFIRHDPQPEAGQISGGPPHYIINDPTTFQDLYDTSLRNLNIVSVRA